MASMYNKVGNSQNMFFPYFYFFNIFIMNPKSSSFPKFTDSIQSIGIDVSKTKLDICFIDVNLQKYIYKIKNTQKSLKEFVKKLNKNSVSKEIPIIIESTWDYHTLASIIISNWWFDLKEINPILTKQFTKATIRWTKTDKIDAYNLAKIWIINKHELRSFDRPLEMIELSKRINLIHTFEKNITSLKASIKNFYEVAINLWFKETSAIKEIKKTIFELEKKTQKINYGIRNI